MSISRPIARDRSSALMKPAGLGLIGSAVYQIKIRFKAVMIADAAPSRCPQRTRLLLSLGVVILAGMQDGNAVTCVDVHCAMKA